jgi:autotransporter-associated beta strand protein
MKNKPNMFKSARVLALPLFLALAGAAQAQSTWTNTTTSSNQSWATAGNWSGGVPNGVGATANITSNIAANQTITLGANRTVGTLNIGDTTDGSNRYTITGNTLIFDATSGSAQLNALAGAGSQAFFINSTVQLNDDLVITINQTGAGFGFVTNAINQNGGDRTLTLTSTVASPGASQFGTANGFTKLVVSGNAIFNNTRVSDDRAMGRVLSSFTADAITLDGGVLRAGRDAAGLQTHTVSANRGITLGAGGGTLNGSDAERVWVVSSVISGSGALNITGPGSTTLNAVNTYEGDTTVVQGSILYVGGELSNSAVTVESGGTIGSNGANGVLGNGLTIDAGGILNLTGATLGETSSGILSITGGGLTLGNLTFQNITGWDWANAAEGTYQLISGDFTVDWGSTAYLDANSAYDFGNGKKGYFEEGSLNVVVIPEPGAALLGGLGLLALLRRRR